MHLTVCWCNLYAGVQRCRVTQGCNAVAWVEAAQSCSLKSGFDADAGKAIWSANVAESCKGHTCIHEGQTCMFHQALPGKAWVCTNKRWIQKQALTLDAFCFEQRA